MLRRRFSRRNLHRLAELHGTDKIYGHNYIDVYTYHFKKFRKLPVTFLEIGVGGYDDPRSGGQSLRMWKDYFFNGNIHALDIFDKSPHQENRIRIFKVPKQIRNAYKKSTRKLGILTS